MPRRKVFRPRRLKKKVRRGKRRTGVVRVGRSLNPFPPQLRTTLVTRFQASAGAVASGNSCQTWKGNAFGNGPTGTAGSGPQFDWAGVFTTNYPTGLVYLLGTSGGATARAPYGWYRVVGSSISVKATPAFYSETVPGAQPATSCRMIIIPSTTANLSALTATQLCEQPNRHEKLLPCAYNLIPAVRNNVTSIWTPASSVVAKVSHKMRSSRAFGIPPSSINDSTDYTGTPNSDPNSLWYWHVITATPSQGAYFISIDTEIKHDVIFYNESPLSTAAPV